MALKPTIQQVAELAGVSIASVSRYINSPERVRTATAQRIQNAIVELGYPLVEQKAAPSIFSPPASKTILICIPSISNPFYNDVIRGIQNSAQRRGYYTLLQVQHLNSATEAVFFDIISNFHFAGAVVLNALSQKYLLQISQKLPMVQCCEFVEGQSSVSYVSIDDIAAIQKMIDYLLSSGHTKFAFLGGPERYKYSRHRKQGFYQAMHQAGLPVNEDWVVSLTALEYNEAYSATQTMLTSAKTLPTAIVTVSDVCASAAIAACKAAGLSVPQDIVVTGFDNTSHSLSSDPPITTINQPRYQLGYTACELLIDKLEIPNISPRHVLLDTELVIRGSTLR